jgi:hypothetical protein
MTVKIYQHDETAITWASSGGTETFTPTSLASNAGRQGAHHDFGTSARSRLFRWRAFIKPGGTRVVNQAACRVYLKTGDGTHFDNDDGTGDIALSSSDKLVNVELLGTILVDENAAVEMSRGGFIEIAERYVAPIFYNGSANALSSTAADFGFVLTPVPDEIQ